MSIARPAARLLGASIIALIASGCSSVPLESLQSGEGDLKVATFNVHYISPRAEEMGWDRRESAVLNVLRDIDADLVAFQEMETFGGGHASRENIQLDSVRSAFPEYGVAAAGNPEIYPSTQPIIYRKSLLEPLEQGFFFFSSTPEVIYSRPWHKRFPAFLSWARFSRRTDGATFYVFNVHTDASSPRNRMKTARLIVERIAGREHPDPVILLGDFNAPVSFPSLRVYRRAGLAPGTQRGSTFHFNRGLHLIPAIDHVLTDDTLRVAATSVVRRKYDGEWPSDHYPVVSLVAFQ